MRKPARHFSEREKRLIIEAWLGSGLSKKEIWEQYTGQSAEHGQILRWMRNLGYEQESTSSSSPFRKSPMEMKQKEGADNPGESFEHLQLKKRIEELEKQLKDSEMKAIAFSTMVDIAEKEFNIPIRKKYNTKRSKK